MKIDWERLKLKFYHLIGRLTGDYYLENKLLLDIKERQRSNIISGTVIGIVSYIITKSLIQEVLGEYLNELSQPVVGRVVLRRIRRGKYVPPPVVSALLDEVGLYQKKLLETPLEK